MVLLGKLQSWVEGGLMSKRQLLTPWVLLGDHVGEGYARAEGCRGHDQRTDILPIVRQPGVSITNLLVPSGLGSTSCGQHTVKFSHRAGVSVSAKQLKGWGSQYCLQFLRKI